MHNYYKDLNNKIHTLESIEFEYLLPNGCTQITEAEADDIRKPLLGELRDSIWNDIKAYRDLKKSSGVKVGNFWYHTDDTSRIQHLGLVMLGANIPPDLMWKTMSGEFVQMHQSLALGIFQAIAFSDTQIFKIAEIHKATMLAMSDPTDYDYKTGWPLVYGE
jgi:hypothetical protein